jgi:hypothetical protein
MFQPGRRQAFRSGRIKEQVCNLVQTQPVAGRALAQEPRLGDGFARSGWRNVTAQATRIW